MRKRCMYKKNLGGGYRPSVVCSVFWIALMVLASGMVNAQDIDPEADNVLRAMSDYLGSLKAYSMKADIDNEIVNMEGQKLQLSAFAEIVVKRPAQMYISRQGMFADLELIYDGKILTLYAPKQNRYTQIEGTGTTDDAITSYEMTVGLEAPGADLLFSDSYAILTEDLNSGTYLGLAYVGGVECHHLAFRKARVDWQIWVTAGGTPLPMKYIITSKWISGAPQYAVRLRDWNTRPVIASGQFQFKALDGARKVENLTVTETGALVIPEEDAQ